MKQHQVIIGLGSNQGDRFLHIKSCIELINNEVERVISVSNIYETPSWGFESASFYNVVLEISTSKKPLKLLEQLLKIETKLGRKRTESTGYQARSIDIDIIAYGEKVIMTEDLQIPHPLMQDRKFVLQPMLDLNLDWKHPILRKTVAKLLKETTDKSEITPLLDLNFSKLHLDIPLYNYIVIEGNIGAGKTTLVSKLAQEFNRKMVLERFSDNPFLPKFYNDQNRYALSLELSFLADRHQQLTTDLRHYNLKKEGIIADYHIVKSLLFAKITLQEEEFQLYKKLFHIANNDLPKPDLYIYLYQNSERLLENIKKRGRNYEQDIKSDYLEAINKSYLEYIIQQSDIKTILINVSDLDFVENQEDYYKILNEINSKL